MGTIINIDAATRQEMQSVLDDLINEFALECRLVYPPSYASCDNCTADILGINSSNHWKTGGPMPFPDMTTCPLCGGTGKRANEATELINLKCVFNPIFERQLPGLKNLQLDKINIRLANAILKTRGFMTDVPKVMRATELIVNIPIEGYIRAKYTRITEPLDKNTFVSGRYFNCFWERVG